MRKEHDTFADKWLPTVFSFNTVFVVVMFSLQLLDKGCSINHYPDDWTTMLIDKVESSEELPKLWHVTAPG